MALGAAVVLAFLFDQTLWTWAGATRAGERDWHRLLRVCGWLPTWIAVGAALWLHDRRPARFIGLVGPAALAGVAAELGKLLVRRQRPGSTGEVVFRSFADRPWDSSDLGMPSSHAAVAFGAAFALARIHPRTAPVAILLAIGCAATRVLDRAHFASDCAVAALVAWMVVALWHRPARE